jgi:predicted secreted Zn-dependent protease
MRTGYSLLLAGILVFVAVSGAYPLTISEFFDRDGNPASSPRMPSGSGPFRGTSGYAVPGGVELRKDITYEYYPVFGRSFSEIVQSAEENGPFVKRRKARFTSKTDWGLRISYHYDFTYEIDEELRTVHATIDISDVAIKYDVAITLPALLDDTSLNAVERKLWRNYFQRLLEREHGRVAVIEDADTRKKMEDDIAEIKGVSFDYTNENDIERLVEVFLKQETQGIAGEGIKKIREKLSEYNRKTGDSDTPTRMEAQ